jgi:hypothetical protein
LNLNLFRKPVESPPVAIDDKTNICTQPFDWEEFLVTLSSKSSASGFLVQGAIQSREYNLNISFGDFKGQIQEQRKGNATVSSDNSLYLLMWKESGHFDLAVSRVFDSPILQQELIEKCYLELRRYSSC